MNILELQEYAKRNGYDNLRFRFTNLRGEEKTGKWVDAYFGFLFIDGMEENTFIRVEQWLGLYSDVIKIQFEPLSH